MKINICLDFIYGVITGLVLGVFIVSALLVLGVITLISFGIRLLEKMLIPNYEPEMFIELAHGKLGDESMYLSSNIFRTAFLFVQIVFIPSEQSPAFVVGWGIMLLVWINVIMPLVLS